MPSRRRILGALLVSATLHACSDAPAARSVVVRDSAGVTIVEHGRIDPGAVPQWSLSATPLVRIGTVDGDAVFQFHQVRDATRLRDGSIAVVDRSRTVRLFDAAGRPLWTAGGEGGGPGEFRLPVMVEELGADSLVVWDGPTSRLNVFTRGGEFVRAAPLRGVEAATTAWGLTDGRHILVGAMRGERQRIDGHEALVHPFDFYLVNLDGTIARELGRRTYVTNFQEVGEGGAFSPEIFGTEAVVGVGRDGLWYGDATEYELREEVGPDRTRRIVRWEGPDRAVTDGDVETLLAGWIDEASSAEVRQYLMKYRDSHPRADRFPAYEQLHVADDGRVWVRDYAREHDDDGMRRWTILSADGATVLGRLTHPAALELHDVGDDWLLAVEKDELDVESLVLYRFVRGS